MRRVATLVLLIGCYRGDDRPTNTMTRAPLAHEGSVPAMNCPTPSALNQRGRQQRGYRLVEDDAELARLRAATGHGALIVNSKAASQSVDALWAAFYDLRGEIQECMIAADGAHPELQYEIRTGVNGSSNATMLSGISVHRIDGPSHDGEPVSAPTTAEACVSELLGRIVLPPGGGFIESMTIVRQDFCTPTAALAMTVTRFYVAAYERWWQTHPGQTCPAELSELGNFGKDPWHQPYVMRCDASGFEVISGGPDRRVGTADDIASHR